MYTESGYKTGGDEQNERDKNLVRTLLSKNKNKINRQFFYGTKGFCKLTFSQSVFINTLRGAAIFHQTLRPTVNKTMK